MNALTQGSRDFHIAGSNRKDEIGEMLRAMVMFKMANRTLRKWAEEREEKAEADLKEQAETQRQQQQLEAQKKADIADLAAQFERSIGDVVSGVAAASSQLQNTASAMAETAGDVHWRDQPSGRIISRTCKTGYRNGQRSRPDDFGSIGISRASGRDRRTHSHNCTAHQSLGIALHSGSGSAT